jgi:hypothetical protein
VTSEVPGACQAGLRGGTTTGGEVVKSCLSDVTVMGERSGFSSFKIGGPSLSTKSGRTVLGME